MSLTLVPVTRDQAISFIVRLHRHSRPPQGYRIAVGVRDGDKLVGVAVAGRPVARMLDDGLTLEVTRVCTDGTPHACSMLYGACWRAARALGYRRAITYTHSGEPGTSVRAAGWQAVADLPARPGWDMPSRHRVTRDAWVARVRWEITAGWVGAAAVVAACPENGQVDVQPQLFDMIGASS